MPIKGLSDAVVHLDKLDHSFLILRIYKDLIRHHIEFLRTHNAME